MSGHEEIEKPTLRLHQDVLIDHDHPNRPSILLHWPRQQGSWQVRCPDHVVPPLDQLSPK